MDMDDHAEERSKDKSESLPSEGGIEDVPQDGPGAEFWQRQRKNSAPKEEKRRGW